MMKKLLVIIFLFFSAFAFAQSIKNAVPPKPSPPRLVNDLADLLTTEQEQALERKLIAYDDSTSSQITVVTLKDLQDYEAADFATELGRKWGVGGSEFNNGVVLLISTGGGEGNRDAFIAVGYGLEGAIPDITANQITDDILIPYLKTGNYYRGIDSSVDALIAAAAGEYRAPANRNRGSGGGGIGRILITFIVIMFILNMFGGRGRGGGGGMVSRRGYRGYGGPVFFPGGFGGSGGGFGGGGGGFGGFGGGGFGGGGAGGKW